MQRLRSLRGAGGQGLLQGLGLLGGGLALGLQRGLQALGHGLAVGARGPGGLAELLFGLRGQAVAAARRRCARRRRCRPGLLQAVVLRGLGLAWRSAWR
ncbi:MAG: hypothetical protein U1E77_11630 [Inhella sp.]